MGKKTTGDILATMADAEAISTLRRLGAACFANAQSLFEDARLLSNEGRLGGASALAVIGVEEFGKAVLYAAAALQPQERGLLGDEASSHELKHLLAAKAEAAQIEVAESWLVAQQESGMPVPPRARLEDLFGFLLRSGVAGLLQPPKEARAFYANLQRQFPDYLLEPEMKNAALYVDLLPTGEVGTPDRVVIQRASPVLSLEWFLEVYKGLEKVLVDDAWWREFSGRVRRPASSSTTA